MWQTALRSRQNRSHNSSIQHSRIQAFFKTGIYQIRELYYCSMKYLITSLFILLQISLFAQSDTLHLLFAGDIMGHGPQIKAAKTGKNTYNYDECFRYIAPIIQKADLAFANLEVTLPGEEPYMGYPMFRTPDAIGSAIKQAGFDVLVTANNHSNDAAALGVTHTIDVLKKNEFLHTGTFRNALERDLYYPLIIYKNGFKLAILNYTYDTNNHRTVPPTMVNEIDETLIHADLETAIALQPDFIITIMHWGKEYELEENETQQALAQKLFEWGSDMVIGAHPHVIQPIKKLPYQNKYGDEKEGLIAYSLGNFISNQKRLITSGGLILEVDLIKDADTNEVVVGENTFHLVWRQVQTLANGKKVFYALPIAIFEKSQKYLSLDSNSLTALNTFAKNMRDHLAKSQTQEAVLNPESYQNALEK